MNAEMVKLVVSYIDKLNNALSSLLQSPQNEKKIKEDKLFDVIIETCNVFQKEMPDSQTMVLITEGTGERDANIVIGRLRLLLSKSGYKEHEENKHNSDSALVFLSHCCKNRKYGDALETFLTSLGVKHEQLIYTSHPLHKIPLDANIYSYLRDHIQQKIFMMILWSDDYLESPACLNEMGAAWVVQCDYTNLYVPTFSFGNPKYHECAVDTRKMGAVLKNDSHCKQAMIELKNKILLMFNLTIDEASFTYLLDQFMKDIEEAAKP